MSIYVYVIESGKDSRLYVGQAKDIAVRVKQHNSGATRSTRYYRPWHLVFKKRCEDRKEARELEKYFKSGCGKEYIKTKICGRGSIG